MSPRFVVAVNSVNPMQSGIGERTLMLRAFRLTSVLAAALMPTYAWFFHASGQPVVDPWALRLGLAAAALGLFALTYVSEGVRRHMRALHEATSYALTTYFAGLTAANGLAPDYAVGYLFVFAGLALSHSIAYTSCAPFARYLAFSMAVALALVAVSPEATVSLPIFLLSIASLAAMLYVVVVARVATYAALACSRERLAAAETLAGMGNWSHDLRTGHRVWSDNLYRLFDVAPADDTFGTSAPSLLTVVRPEDRAAVERCRDSLIESGSSAEVRFRATVGGEPRGFRIVAAVDRDRAGRPVQLTGAVVDVTDDDRREAELRAARDRAEEGARAKSAFLANMSHEIRTPLTAIIGFAQLLGEETGPEHRDLVGPIESGGLRLLDTLNSVLDLARMEAGHADLALAPVDVGAEVRAVVEMLGGRAAERGLALTADVAPGMPHALADRGALGRVLANLVSNAVKFTDAGRVRVCVYPAGGAPGGAPGGGVEVAVTDTGCGMDDAFLATLYEPFQQASTGWGRSHEGTGLGLTITRRLVEDMGGTIRVESRKGEGTTFAVVLPAAETSAGLPVEASASTTARARAAA